MSTPKPYAYITTPAGSLTTPPDSPKVLIHTRKGWCVGGSARAVRVPRMRRTPRAGGGNWACPRSTLAGEAPESRGRVEAQVHDAEIERRVDHRHVELPQQFQGPSFLGPLSEERPPFGQSEAHAVIGQHVRGKGIRVAILGAK